MTKLQKITKVSRASKAWNQLRVTVTWKEGKYPFKLGEQVLVTIESGPFKGGD